MRKILAIVAFALLVMTSHGAFAEGKQDFDLVNKTGYRIEKVYVSPNNSDDWEEDVLGKGVMDDGEKVHIRFHRSATGCSWDLKVVYDDGEAAIWHGIDLCSVEKITIKWNKSTGVTSATFD